MVAYLYYDRDSNGIEHCYCLDSSELVEDMQRILHVLAPDSFPVEIIDGNVYKGFKSLEELRSNKANDIDVLNWIKIASIGAEKFGYPFAIVTHINENIDKYEACSVDDIQWFKLILEYAAPYKYQVDPYYYEYNELTDLQAEALGFHALARELKDFYA